MLMPVLIWIHYPEFISPSVYRYNWSYTLFATNISIVITMGPKYSFFWDWVQRLFTVQILPTNKPRGMLKVFQCFDRNCHIQGCRLWRDSVIGSPRKRLNYISFRCSIWKRHGNIIYLTDHENELLKRHQSLTQGYSNILWKLEK
jgi:hypothetical protein